MSVDFSICGWNILLFLFNKYSKLPCGKNMWVSAWKQVSGARRDKKRDQKEEEATRCMEHLEFDGS